MKYNFFRLKNIILQKKIIIKIFIIFVINFYIQIYSSKISSNKYINKFAILGIDCPTCGLFAIYKHSIGCLLEYINKGYIPIIDLLSLPNVFNKLNSKNISLKTNPWEYFFNQPYNYSLETVKKNAKHLKYFKCNPIVDHLNFPDYSIYSNKDLSDFWHKIAVKYIPIKLEIVKESNIIIKKLFKDSKNVLGVLARGTDYISLKPKNHPKQPDTNNIISDIKKMDLNYKYDWIFLTTEDYFIKKKFIRAFKNKLKYLKKYNNINYNYKEKKYLCFNKNINGNFNYSKNYLINILILSKCIDIISTLTSGTIGTFILTEGFRNSKIYFSGYY